MKLSDDADRLRTRSYTADVWFAISSDSNGRKLTIFVSDIAKELNWKSWALQGICICGSGTGIQYDVEYFKSCQSAVH